MRAQSPLRTESEAAAAARERAYQEAGPPTSELLWDDEGTSLTGWGHEDLGTSRIALRPRELIELLQQSRAPTRTVDTRTVGTQMAPAPASLAKEVDRHGEPFSLPISRPTRVPSHPEVPLPGEASASYNVYLAHRRSSGSSATLRLQPGTRKYSSTQIAGESVQRQMAILAEVESGKAIVTEAPGCLMLPDRYDVMNAVTETSEPKAVPRIGVGTLITDAIKKIPSQRAGFVCTNVFSFECNPENAALVCWRVRSLGSLPGYRADERRALDLSTNFVVAVQGANLIYPIYLAPSSVFGTSGFVPIVADYSNVRSKASALSEYGMPGPAANSYAPYVQL